MFQEGIHAEIACPITLVAGLCTTCRGYRVLIVIRFIVTTFLPQRLYWKKCVGLPVSWTIQEVQQCMVARFDAVRFFLLVFVLILWTLQPHFTLWLSAQLLRLRACARHNAFVLHRSLAGVGLHFLNMLFSCPSLNLVFYQVLRVSQQLC